jgi:hypothetical protein
MTSELQKLKAIKARSCLCYRNFRLEIDTRPDIEEQIKIHKYNHAHPSRSTNFRKKFPYNSFSHKPCKGVAATSRF